MPTSRFSVEIDSTGDPAALLAELRRICDLSFTTSRVQRTITSGNEQRLREAVSGHSPTWD